MEERKLPLSNWNPKDAIKRQLKLSSIAGAKLVHDIQSTNYDPNFVDRYWRAEAYYVVENKVLGQKFEAYKSEQLNLGRPPETLVETLLFSYESEKSCQEICQEGQRVYLKRRHVLGHTGSGVHLVRHYDILTRYMAQQNAPSPTFVVIYKVMLGKTKPIVPRLHKEDTYVRPATGFDGHVSARPVEANMPICEALNCSYVYLFEHDEISSNTVKYPRQILPYAIIHLEKKSPVLLENPLLAIASKSSGSHWEVKGETRRGFRFMFTKSGLKGKYKTFSATSRERLKPEYQTKRLKEQLREMRAKKVTVVPPVLQKVVKENSVLPDDEKSPPKLNPVLGSPTKNKTCEQNENGSKRFADIDIRNIKCTYDQSKQLLSMKPCVKLKRLYGNHRQKKYTVTRKVKKSLQKKYLTEPIENVKLDKHVEAMATLDETCNMVTKENVSSNTCCIEKGVTKINVPTSTNSGVIVENDNLVSMCDTSPEIAQEDNSLPTNRVMPSGHNVHNIENHVETQLSKGNKRDKRYKTRTTIFGDVRHTVVEKTKRSKVKRTNKIEPMKVRQRKIPNMITRGTKTVTQPVQIHKQSPNADVQKTKAIKKSNMTKQLEKNEKVASTATSINLQTINDNENVDNSEKLGLNAQDKFRELTLEHILYQHKGTSKEPTVDCEHSYSRNHINNDSASRSHQGLVLKQSTSPLAGVSAPAILNLDPHISSAKVLSVSDDLEQSLGGTTREDVIDMNIQHQNTAHVDIKKKENVQSISGNPNKVSETQDTHDSTISKITSTDFACAENVGATSTDNVVRSMTTRVKNKNGDSVAQVDDMSCDVDKGNVLKMILRRKPQDKTHQDSNVKQTHELITNDLVSGNGLSNKDDEKETGVDETTENETLDKKTHVKENTENRKDNECVQLGLNCTSNEMTNKDTNDKENVMFMEQPSSTETPHLKSSSLKYGQKNDVVDMHQTSNKSARDKVPFDLCLTNKSQTHFGSICKSTMDPANDVTSESEIPKSTHVDENVKGNDLATNKTNGMGKNVAVEFPNKKLSENGQSKQTEISTDKVPTDTSHHCQVNTLPVIPVTDTHNVTSAHPTVCEGNGHMNSLKSPYEPIPDDNYKQLTVEEAESRIIGTIKRVESKPHKEKHDIKTNPGLSNLNTSSNSLTIQTKIVASDELKKDHIANFNGDIVAHCEQMIEENINKDTFHFKSGPVVKAAQSPNERDVSKSFTENKSKQIVKHEVGNKPPIDRASAANGKSSVSVRHPNTNVSKCNVRDPVNKTKTQNDDTNIEKFERFRTFLSSKVALATNQQKRKLHDDFQSGHSNHATMPKSAQNEKQKNDGLKPWEEAVLYGKDIHFPALSDCIDPQDTDSQDTVIGGLLSPLPCRHRSATGSPEKSWPRSSTNATQHTVHPLVSNHVSDIHNSITACDSVPNPTSPAIGIRHPNGVVNIKLEQSTAISQCENVIPIKQESVDHIDSPIQSSCQVNTSQISPTDAGHDNTESSNCRNAIIETLKELSVVLQFLSDNNKGTVSSTTSTETTTDHSACVASPSIQGSGTDQIVNVKEEPVAIEEPFRNETVVQSDNDTIDQEVTFPVRIKSEPVDEFEPVCCNVTTTQNASMNLNSHPTSESIPVIPLPLSQRDALPCLFDQNDEPDITTFEDFGIPSPTSTPKKKVDKNATESEIKSKQIASSTVRTDMECLEGTRMGIFEPLLLLPSEIKKEHATRRPGSNVQMSKPGLLNKGFKQRKNMFDLKINSSKRPKTFALLSKQSATPPATCLRASVPCTPVEHQDVDVSRIPLPPSPYPNGSKNSSDTVDKLSKDVVIPTTVIKSDVPESKVEIEMNSDHTDALTHTVETLTNDQSEQDNKTNSNITDKHNANAKRDEKQGDENQKKYTDGVPIIPFSKVMELKREQFRKYRYGRSNHRFIDYNEVRHKLRMYRGRSVVRKEPLQSSKRSKSKHNDKRSNDGNRSRKQSDGKEGKERDSSKRSRSKSSHRSSSPRSRNSSENRRSISSDKKRKCSMKMLYTDPKQWTRKRRLVSKTGTILIEDIEEVVPVKIGTSFNPATYFKRQQHQVVPLNRNQSNKNKTTFAKSGTGYFSWKRKYQPKKEVKTVGQKFPGLNAEQIEERQRAREREVLRKNIEESIRDYRRTFQNTGGDKKGDAKVASFLQYLTEKLEVLQVKRDNLNSLRSGDKISIMPMSKGAYKLRDQFDSIKNEASFEMAGPSRSVDKHSESLDDLLKEHLSRHYEHMTKQIKEELMKQLTQGLSTSVPMQTQMNYSQEMNSIPTKSFEYDRRNSYDRHSRSQSSNDRRSFDDRYSDISDMRYPDQQMEDYSYRVISQDKGSSRSNSYEEKLIRNNRQRGPLLPTPPDVSLENSNDSYASDRYAEDKRRYDHGDYDRSFEYRYHSEREQSPEIRGGGLYSSDKKYCMRTQRIASETRGDIEDADRHERLLKPHYMQTKSEYLSDKGSITEDDKTESEEEVDDEFDARTYRREVYLSDGLLRGSVRSFRNNKRGQNHQQTIHNETSNSARYKSGHEGNGANDKIDRNRKDKSRTSEDEDRKREEGKIEQAIRFLKENNQVDVVQDKNEGKRKFIENCESTSRDNKSKKHRSGNNKSDNRKHSPFYERTKFYPYEERRHFNYDKQKSDHRKEHSVGDESREILYDRHGNKIITKYDDYHRKERSYKSKKRVYDGNVEHAGPTSFHAKKFTNWHYKPKYNMRGHHQNSHKTFHFNSHRGSHYSSRGRGAYKSRPFFKRRYLPGKYSQHEYNDEHSFVAERSSSSRKSFRDVLDNIKKEQKDDDEKESDDEPKPIPILCSTRMRPMYKRK